MYGLMIPSSDDDGETDELTDTEWYTPRQQSEAREAASPTSHAAVRPLPTELWEMVMGHLQRELVDDAFPGVGVLLNCALVCRTWAGIALPLLYRTHGYGVFLPLPATRDSRTPLFPISTVFDSPTAPVTNRHLSLWRTLLLSLFTCLAPTPHRFAAYPDATLFPYISYVRRLDLRSLPLVLRAIANPPPTPPAHRDAIGPGAAEYFLGGALGAFEISGAARGRRMVVGGPEYRVSSPVEGKELRVWTGDTALMMLDLLYQHIPHLEAVTIPELGELRVHEPLDMRHPASMLSQLRNLRSLVISSGWMLSRGLGEALARLLRTNPQHARLALTILDCRNPTSYAVHAAGPFRHCPRDFFAALPADSVRTLVLHLAARPLPPLPRSLRALHISRPPLPLSALLPLLPLPRALSLSHLPPDPAPPSAPPPVLLALHSLALAHVPGMFELLLALLQSPPRALHSLALTYSAAETHGAGFVEFLARGLCVLGRRLRVLRLVDVGAPRLDYPLCVRLEGFARLETLVLVGGVVAVLGGVGGLERVLRGAPGLRAVELSVVRGEVGAGRLRGFARCRRLERLVLREWGAVVARGLTVGEVKGFLDRCAVVRVGVDGAVRVLEELGIAGGLLEVAGGRNWGELREWARATGTRFEWNPGEMRITP